jgi:hypothetical protein
VHHASAGMIMLVEYEGFAGPDTAALRQMVGATTAGSAMAAMDHGDAGDDHAHEADTSGDHAHEPTPASGGHEHAPGTPDDHHASEQLKPLVSPAWWLLLVIALIIMIPLSIGVYKFIHVKK